MLRTARQSLRPGLLYQPTTVDDAEQCTKVPLPLIIPLKPVQRCSSPESSAPPDSLYTADAF
jgi:hypothetical protein